MKKTSGMMLESNRTSDTMKTAQLVIICFKNFLYGIVPAAALYACKDLSFDTAFFPLSMSSLILVCGIIALFDKKAGAQFLYCPKRIALLAASLLMFYFFIDFLGFYPCAFFLTIFLYIFIDKTSTWRSKISGALLTGAITTILMFLLFNYALQLMLPNGELYRFGALF